MVVVVTVVVAVIQDQKILFVFHSRQIHKLSLWTLFFSSNQSITTPLLSSNQSITSPVLSHLLLMDKRHPLKPNPAQLWK